MVRDLQPRLLGRTVARVEAPWPGSVVWPSFDEFVRRLTGREIRGVSRRGKYALVALDSRDTLIVHRGMTGSLLLRERDDPMEAHVRLRLELDDGGEVRFNDPRKFGKVFLMEAGGTERPLPWSRMGPEPLNGHFSPASLKDALRGRKGLIKPLLLNQRIVAGLGNIYVDEALYRARIHPLKRAGALTPPEVARLHGAIRDVLTEAVEGRGTTFSSYTDIEGRAGNFQRSLQVFHRAGEACPRCGQTIRRLVVGGRGTHICPGCQEL